MKLGSCLNKLYCCRVTLMWLIIPTTLPGSTVSVPQDPSAKLFHSELFLCFTGTDDILDQSPITQSVSFQGHRSILACRVTDVLQHLPVKYSIVMFDLFFKLTQVFFIHWLRVGTHLPKYLLLFKLHFGFWLLEVSEADSMHLILHNT